MKAGVNLINFGPGASPDSLAQWVHTAENLGYHLAMVSDHVAVTPDVHERYPAPSTTRSRPYLGWREGHPAWSSAPRWS